MSSWHALNVEPENEEEVEIDDSKEIQIEEALKLYQTALKYHAEGPQSFEKTGEAYRALFESEIFKYNESISEYKRHELFGDELVFDSILDDFDAGPVQTAGGNESAPNTLPQLLHLSYKNHGQFILETMQHWASQHGIPLQQESPGHVVSALSNFAEALDKEDTDLDLWLRTASVAAMLGSSRITRFCLEAVLDGNDEAYDSLLRLPGLEEGFAGHQLRELVTRLEDTLSLQQPPLASLMKKKLSETLKKRLNPYPWAPVPSEISGPVRQAVDRPPQRVILSPVKWDWAGAGDAILRHYMTETNTLIESTQPGCAIALDVPPEVNITEPTENANVQAETEMTEPPKGVVISEKDEPAAPGNDSKTAAKDGDDAVMADQERPTDGKADEAESATLAENGRELSRKRSTDSAGLPETAEGGRARSKRLRARDSEVGTGVEAMGQTVGNTLEDQLWPFTNADKCLREVINDQFERLGVQGLGVLEELRNLVSNSTPVATATDSIDKAACDLHTALHTSGSKIAPVLLSAEPMDLGGASREAGLNAFLGYSKSSTAQACAKATLQSEKLTTFIQSIKDAWLSSQEVAFAWVEALLSPSPLFATSNSTQSSKSSYVQYRWPEDLKRQVVQVLVNVDEFIYDRMLDRLEALNARILEAQEQTRQYKLSELDIAQFEMIETIFELHLDVYSLIKHPSSGVNQSTQTEQSDRLSRWVSLAREAMQLRSSCDLNAGSDDELVLRHVWASVFHLSVSDDVLPQNVLYAMEELKEIFKSSDGHIIEVQNNAVMPELSVAAVDRELVRISMKDFFLKVFDTDEKDPVAVIESLEPILEPSQEADQMDDDNANGVGEDHDETSAIDHDLVSADMQRSRPSPLQEMRKFLDSASVSLRLSLWQRLREAYEAIEYPPKVLSCYLRSIETLTGKFSISTYQECSDADRHVELIRCFRIVDEIVVKVLQIIRDEKDALACLTYEHMQSSMSAISQLLRILSAANCLQDSIRVGQLSVPRYMDGFPPSTFTNLTNRLNDVQVRLWILQYYLFREGISQTPNKFETPSDEQFVFLRHVHHTLGVRSCGHAAGRLFLRLAKDEMLSFQDLPEPETLATELSQVLYDLYGLKTFIDPSECQEYGSNADILDRSAAMKLMTFILSQASKMNIKDLVKHELRNTIERVHGALGRPRVHEEITHNGKTLKAYLKSPINPTDLLSCLKGVGTLPTKPILADASVAPAAKGWYFLMGNLALTKFKSQKRTTQAPTEDVNFAQAFFLQDLEFCSERWETWYRLAQANDTQLEEAISWTAEKINSNSVELINWQRAAIHCYSMAVNCAVRDEDLVPETLAKVAHMYADFGNRVYASSREPFSMTAFAIKDTEHKFYSGQNDAPIYQNLPFAALLPYTAWKFAGVLFKRAAQGEPDKWWNHYMLAKCLWKMHCANIDEIRRALAEGRPPTAGNGPPWEEVIKAIVNAINAVPEKKERGREPILEPHYKLVSFTHKLFLRKAIDHEKGVELLSNTPFSENISSPENSDEWEGYILRVLKALRNTDKSSWHHRIIARAAHVIYDESNDIMVAQGAKHELTQQIFTKTMAVQVWKPEYERPGRHFVYTSRYTKFFVHLLNQTGDQPNLEALARRVRRKQTDFFEHTKLWHELCQTYLQLLRRMGQIPDGQEDIVFRALNYEEYNIQATRLEAWCQDPHSQHPALDVLRHTVELKRVNNGLMKAVPIDDLLGDTFALLYNTVGPTLPPLPSEQKQPPPTGTATPETGAHHGAGNPFLPPVAHAQLDGAVPGTGHSAPFNLFHPSQLQPQAQPQPPPQPPTEPVPKPRAKTVGRREIQRRAEVCAQKPAGAAAPPTTSVMPIRSPPATTHTILPSSTATMQPTHSPDKPTPPEPAPTPAAGFGAAPTLEPPNVPTSGTVTAAASVTADERSAPASVHDDADDESELSELDEDEVQEMGHQIHASGVGMRAISAPRPSLFPNLKRSMDREEKETDTEGSGKGTKRAKGRQGMKIWR
ncbi:Histone transcription regulator 3 [Didymosphaeria variabile]|uniref:Histone transcription regulator 3 homolog n=1 Tax=Didymosphaeria variabile TaxID=1932322 RepID=A0A9W9C9N8_9PLEO|nr:Histone transcription regulator 3 [Didymosphaeria variabile]KAJ4350227.1 Histone transcription regulator 3 [Didymosphaeria variabile]